MTHILDSKVITLDKVCILISFNTKKKNKNLIITTLN